MQQPKNYVGFVMSAVGGVLLGTIAFGVLCAVIISAVGHAGNAGIPIAFAGFILIQILSAVCAWKFGSRGVATASGADGLLFGIGIGGLGIATLCEFFTWGIGH